MRYIKFAVWLIGLVTLLWLAHNQGFNNGSAYIQFADGAVLVYGAGEYIEKRSHIKQFVESHHRMHARVEHLHDKVDTLGKQVGKGG